MTTRAVPSLLEPPMHARLLRIVLVRAVSPTTDSSFDFHDLLLVPAR